MFVLNLAVSLLAVMDGRSVFLYRRKFAMLRYWAKKLQT